MRLYLILFFLYWTTISFGQGWQKFYGTYADEAGYGMQQTIDGGYILSMKGPNGLALIKTDVNGTVIWQQEYPTGTTHSISGESVRITTDGGYIVCGSLNTPVFTATNGYLIKTDINGDTLWTKSFPFAPAFSSVSQTNNGGYALIGSEFIGSTTENILVRTNTIGDTIWTLTSPGLAYSLSQTNDQSFVTTGNTDSNDIFLSKIDSNGQLLWSETYGINFGRGYSVKQTNDGGYIIVGTNNNIIMIKTDANGILQWSQTYPNTYLGSSVEQTSDGGYIIAGYDRTYIPASGDYDTALKLIKTDVNGNIIWENTLEPQSYNISINAVETIGGGFALLSNIHTLSSFFTLRDLHLARFDSTGYLYSGILTGQIYQDNNNDCFYSLGTDSVMKGVVVEIKNSTNGQITFATTDSNGVYETNYIDTGEYIIGITSDLPYHTYNCQSIFDTLDFTAFHQTKSSDFALSPLFNCPLLYVDISAPFIRQTNTGSYYTISYCNNGTADATNTYIEVDLDPNLTILSSSVSISSQVNNIYRFNIGNVDLGHCGSFNIQVIGNTNAIAGQTICSEAHIYPDSICIPNFWNGPILDATAQCLNDTIYFEVQNKGTAMAIGNTYYVYEDNIMLRTGITNPLGINTSQQIIQAAAQDKTYRFEVEQNTNFPSLLGDSVTSASVLNCNPLSGGLFTPSFLSQFSNGSSAPFEAIDCQPLITSYDPNDKSAQPVGYGNNHYIYDYIALDYKIRFQNTGTDTAFRVVVRDTLSPFLDPTSIQMGASSHNYTWQVYGSNILEVTFDNILLPDSTTNELASNGFFRFRIEQQTANPLGSIIYNSAAIYFDYNAPIITNETFHTISDNFVIIQLLGTEDLLTKDISNIKFYPNPFKEQSTIEIVGKTYDHLELRIYDLTGKLVQQQNGTGNLITVQRHQLEAGMYLYQLEGDQELLNTGKLIAR